MTFGDTLLEQGMEADGMRPSMRATVFACVALSFLCGPLFSRAAKPTAVDTPGRLVHAALEAELTGATDQRTQLLAEALALDPEFAPARWQAGYVRIGDEWIKIDDVPKRVAGDPQLAAYRQQRDGMIDTADNHRELARWCRKNRLPDEERIHWIKVLEFNQQDAEALEALGLELYEGRLLTKSQIAAEKLAAGERMKAMRKWQPQLLKWRKAIEGNSAEAREVALAKLRSFNEPVAVPLLEALFSVDGEGTPSLKRNELLIDVLSRIPGREATEALLRRAILPDSKDVRIAAARALKGRPPSTFVPQLIGLLPANESLQTRHRIYLAPGDVTVNGVIVLGTVMREHEFIVRNLDTGNVRSFSFLDEDRQPIGEGTPLALRIVNRIGFYYEYVAALERQFEVMRRNRQELGARVQTALVASTDFGAASSVEQWLGRINDYYETYSPPIIPSQIQPEVAEFHQVRYTASCFPEGTPVQTHHGSVAVETIKPGDRVLSQNPATGELAYKTIQAVTLRPAAPLVEIGIGSETLRATRGHPFWVNGEGWQLAKHLTVGAQLHATGGAVTIDSIGEGRPQEAYNLVVSDFGTYFVGNSQVLVHDNMPLAETVTLVPGLAVQADVP